LYDEGFSGILIKWDNQFGFKKGLWCRNAIYTARNIVDQYIKGGNHHALLFEINEETRPHIIFRNVRKLAL